MKTTKLNVLVSAGFVVMYIISFAVLPLFQKPIKFSDVAVCGFALLSFVLVLRKIKPIYFFGVQLFTYFAKMLGSSFGFYIIFPWYDLFLHCLSGILLAFLGEYLVVVLNKKPTHNISPSVYYLFCFLFSVASAGIWEIWEYCGDVFFNLQSQGPGINDTMTDIIAGTSGAVVGTLLLFIINKNSNKLKTANKNKIN